MIEDLSGKNLLILNHRSGWRFVPKIKGFFLFWSSNVHHPGIHVLASLRWWTYLGASRGENPWEILSSRRELYLPAANMLPLLLECGWKDDFSSEDKFLWPGIPVTEDSVQQSFSFLWLPLLDRRSSSTGKFPGPLLVFYTFFDVTPEAPE